MKEPTNLERFLWPEICCYLERYGSIRSASVLEVPQPDGPMIVVGYELITGETGELRIYPDFRALKNNEMQAFLEGLYANFKAQLARPESLGALPT